MPPARSATSRSLSAAGARRQLGAGLRTLREATGLTLEDAAKVIQRSSATMSRLERGGPTPPRLVDVKALLDLYAERNVDLVTDEVRASMSELVQESRRDEWFNEYRDVLGSTLSPTELQRLVELETDAREFLSFEDKLIPGLLQTHAYAAAVAAISLSKRSAADRDRFVEFRIARQRVLDHHLRLHVVISEDALRRTLGSAAVMVEQLETLIKELRNGRQNVTIQIAPSTLVSPATMQGPFVLMRFEGEERPQVFLEGRAGPSYLSRPAEIARYEAEFAQLTADALDREHSLAILEEVVAGYH